MELTKKQLLDKYKPYPTYTQIAEEAYNLGYKKGKEINQTEKAKRDVEELNRVKAELKNLWETLEDPEKCGELLAGM